MYDRDSLTYVLSFFTPSDDLSLAAVGPYLSVHTTEETDKKPSPSTLPSGINFPVYLPFANFPFVFVFAPKSNKEQLSEVPALFVKSQSTS